MTGRATRGAAAVLPPGDPVEEALERVRWGLGGAAAWAAAHGMPAPEPRGQLIRPLVAWAVAERLLGPEAPEGFWHGAFAVQLAHEASLVHDDIVDGAASRRGERTVAAARGVGAALVYGDHLLTAAYRVALRAGSPTFAELFAHAVERTVAGEIAQGSAAGRALALDEYLEVATEKSGELIGCAAALAPALAGHGDVPGFYDLGRRVGRVYQMLDDLLDYCPATDTGKPPLGDFAQRRWTWPLHALPDVDFDEGPEAVMARLRTPLGEVSPLRRCLSILEGEVAALEEAVRARLGGSELLLHLLRDWGERARRAVAREEDAARRPAARRPEPSAELRARVPDAAGVDGYLLAHSRSFHFAARIFPPAERARIARLYAFCRVTDDLVDRPAAEGAAGSEALLEEWLELARRAYGGAPSGIPFLDATMREMADAGVTFTYAAELVEGMRMDLRECEYRDLAELQRYTYRVASVVGLWICGLYGVRDPGTLRRAAEMGHAMQLTNILRDVGEDLRSGRVYLPGELLERHGVSREALRGMAEGRIPILRGYRALVEELAEVAEASYRSALPGVADLPLSLRRPVAVAAYVYRGILAELRRHGCDNFRTRARTAGHTKLWLAGRALWDLRRAQHGRGPAVEGPLPPVRAPGDGA